MENKKILDTINNLVDFMVEIETGKWYGCGFDKEEVFKIASWLKSAYDWNKGDQNEK